MTRYDAAIAPLPAPAIAELRGDPGAARALLVAAGLTVPSRPNSAASTGEREALWLGPKRWLVFAPAAEERWLEAHVGSAAREPLLAAAIVSDMFAGIAVRGAGSRDVVAQGTPLDLDALAADGATMTDLFGVAALLRPLPAPGIGIAVWVDRSLARFVAESLEAANGA
ncbi:MAG: hypothetical protein JNL66_22850 [Alphaproteobacteria bacterium]|nr:hypothetical protein [Alphaproteobacteria bacterium]